MYLTGLLAWSTHYTTRDRAGLRRIVMMAYSLTQKPSHGRLCCAGICAQMARPAEPGTLQGRLHHHAGALAGACGAQKGCAHQGCCHHPEACARPAVQRCPGFPAQSSHTDPGDASVRLTESPRISKALAATTVQSSSLVCVVACGLPGKLCLVACRRGIGFCRAL